MSIIEKMKETLQSRAKENLVKLEESSFELAPLYGKAYNVPVVTAYYADGSIEELRLYNDPNALWLAVEPGDDVKSLELYCGDEDDPEYIGSWTVINGEIQK